MQPGLDETSPFHLRRAVERLREGLFDPVAVRALTAHQERLDQAVDEGFGAVENGEAPHLCICGTYGQGKSHSLNYIQDRALGANFATSLINLDPREVPFHNFQQVYRALMENLRLPGAETALVGPWRAWIEERLDAQGRAPLEVLPAEIPHTFRAVLAAIGQKTVSLSPRQRQTKKHASYKPRAFPYLLSRALSGDVVPTLQLRPALKYRQVDFYKDASLRCAGTEPYLQMVRGLGRLFCQMGYRGWVILFDEGESMAQTRITCRSRSYQTLDRMFFPEVAVRGLFPVFAFTGDFFQQVADEDFDRVKARDEMPYFDKDYAVAWRGLRRFDLQDLSPREWEEMGGKLMQLHARAYGWQPAAVPLRQALTERLVQTRSQETRYRLKALVDELDLARQDQVLPPRM